MTWSFDFAAPAEGMDCNSDLVYGCRASESRVWISAISTICPAYMTATRSAISATTPKSWVIRTTPASLSSFKRLMSSRICNWMVTSSAVVGSSAISSFGSSAMAMAMMIRCRIPPDSSWGYRP